jgi:polyhydroxybutyrate depolymerase
MNTHPIVCILLTGLLLSTTPDEDIHVWTGSDGQSLVEASLVDGKYDRDQKTTVLTLKKKDGTTVEVSANRLSSESRQLATRILAQRRSAARRDERKKRYDAGRREKAQREAERRILPPLPRPTTLMVDVNGVERFAIVYPGIRSNEVPSPVLIWFHGYTGKAVEVARRRRLHQLWPIATIVYPQGLDTGHGRGDGKPGWKDDRYGPWKEDNRDIHFVDQLIEELSARCKVDRNRIYAGGHSRGGFFSFLLLLHRAEVFAAFAPTSCHGPCVREARTPRPVLYLFGDEDKVFDADQGKAHKTLERLLKLNKCSHNRKTTLPNGCQLFAPNAGGEPVVWCFYHGGHGLPKGVDELVVQFLQEHALEEPEDPSPQADPE